MTPTSNPREETAVEIFCAYAQKDEALQQMLKLHLDGLQTEGSSLLWHERALLPGMDQAQEMDQHINSASLILLLVSADFLATHYSYSSEMARAFARHAAGEVRIIPIILRTANWQNQPFARLQALPSDGRPITNRPNQDEAFADAAKSINQVLRMREPGPAKPPKSTYTRGADRMWNAPFALNPLFTEHDQLLIRIFTQLLLNQSVAISEPDGNGKSRLATEYIYRHCQQYQAILWVDADTPTALNASYAKLAMLLYERQDRAGEQTVNARAVKSWLETNKHWLLILDNLDDPTVLFPVDKDGQIPPSSPFLPATLNGHLLITTRVPQLDLGLTRATAIVDLSSEEHA